VPQHIGNRLQNQQRSARDGNDERHLGDTFKRDPSSFEASWANRRMKVFVPLPSAHQLSSVA
jgi:hypothetical protein